MTHAGLVNEHFVFNPLLRREPEEHARYAAGKERSNSLRPLDSDAFGGQKAAGRRVERGDGSGISVLPSAFERPTIADAEIIAQIPAARARERQARARGTRATRVKYDALKKRVSLELTNGCSFAFPVSMIPALRRVSTASLRLVGLDPSGIAIQWPALIVDLSVPGLLLSAIDIPARRRELARLAGATTSPAKAAAARANGAKGGRPRGA